MYGFSGVTIASEAESWDVEVLSLRQDKGYHVPAGVLYLVALRVATFCKNCYPVHFMIVDAKSQRTLIDEHFSESKSVGLAKTTEKY